MDVDGLYRARDDGEHRGERASNRTDAAIEVVKFYNGLQSQNVKTSQKQQGMNGPKGKGIGPNTNMGPKGPPPNMKGGQVANGSGGAFQDPSGFPSIS